MKGFQKAWFSGRVKMTAVISHVCITSCISESCPPLRPWLESYLFHKASLIPLISASQHPPRAPSHIPQFSVPETHFTLQT